MRTSKPIVAVLAFLLGASQGAVANDKVGGGGLAYVMEFKDTARELLRKSIERGIQTDSYSHVAFQTAIDATRITFVPMACLDRTKLGKCPKALQRDAANFPDLQPPAIDVTESKWAEIRGNLRLRDHLVLHEYFGILRIEKNDDIHSSALLNQLERPEEPVKKVSPPSRPEGPPHPGSRLPTAGFVAGFGNERGPVGSYAEIALVFKYRRDSRFYAVTSGYACARYESSGYKRAYYFSGSGKSSRPFGSIYGHLNEGVTADVCLIQIDEGIQVSRPRLRNGYKLDLAGTRPDFEGRQVRSWTSPDTYNGTVVEVTRRYGSGYYKVWGDIRPINGDAGAPLAVWIGNGKHDYVLLGHDYGQENGGYRFTNTAHSLERMGIDLDDVITDF